MEYFESLNNLKKNDYILEMEKYADTYDVPIITQDGLLCLCNVIKLINAKKILEIGCAIGYCSSVIALQDKKIHIDTIERVQKMYNIAIANVKNNNLDKQINVIYGDALNVDLGLLKKEYDLIFIDAAKAQYRKFFERYEPLLKKGGVIVCDNLLFHGLIEHEEGEEVTRDVRQLLRKIRVYNEWLKNNPNYDTTFLRIGDGVSISVKK